MQVYMALPKIWQDFDDDSHMRFNIVDMHPSVVIAESGLYNDGSVHGHSGNTLHALGDDSPGASVDNISPPLQVIPE